MEPPVKLWTFEFLKNTVFFLPVGALSVFPLCTPNNGFLFLGVPASACIWVLNKLFRNKENIQYFTFYHICISLTCVFSRGKISYYLIHQKDR